jgi:UPF0716 protein FxsA
VEIHRQLLAEEIPTKELLDLFLILLGSVMLILPGFATDIFGLCMLVPPLRWTARNMLLMLLRRMIPAVSAGAPSADSGPAIKIVSDEDTD